MTKEERIQQIKACGQTIIDEAEKIYGDFPYQTDLEIVIRLASKEFPVISVRQDFFSQTMLDSFCKS